MSELRLLVSARLREGARALDAPETTPPDPSIESLVAALGAGRVADSRLILAGGEPTLRADLPSLLEALAAHAPVLLTDGLALGQASTLRTLERAGLRGLRVTLHAARADANDWVVGRPGATKGALRALREAASIGLRTEIEATLTRPTAPYAAELLGVAERLGARAVHLRRLVLRGAAEREAVMMSPRLGLLEDALEEAAAAAIRARVALRVHGFPRCVAPRIGPALAPPGERGVIFADTPAWRAYAAQLADGYEGRCGSCPGAPSCLGAPLDYVRRFGPLEILSERGAPERSLVSAPRAQTELPAREPPARAGRSPATRVGAIRRLVAAGAPEGDPLLEVPAATPLALSVHFDDAEHEGAPRPSSRALRARLLRAAQEGARTLLVVGGLDHPDAAALLREAARLPGPEVIVAGDLGSLAAMSDADVYALKGLSRLEAMLLADTPAAHDARTRAGHFEAQRAFLERVSSIAGVPTGYYAVVDAGDSLEGFASLNVTRVRLGERGGSLRELTRSWAQLPAGALRDALARVLPRCLTESQLEPVRAPRFVHQALASAAVEAAEPVGTFSACPCGSSHCVGIASGWARS